ncbi:MAG: cell division protein FtsZ [Bacteroidales bacterium]|nr:cell division protein FtsZ [Bacteroidales bacterium]MDD2322363.1 cell division protein FtsZ [Bacteroidales bacterium]MDD3009854.1 cell division protein FtsZ [Bacteroidales bacterium]MDD3960931.1 cell division protein FtsZ [Bacteroidales bacterium]MDY0285609.1 cell division protein FtsZ [Bacteroidales bacterium]
MTDILEFNAPKDRSSIIKVIGVGGGGSNAVNHMFNLGIKGVDFIICNTDAQALDSSPVPNKIQLGSSGLGAGAIPTVARDGALAKSDEIRRLLESNTKMLFITAGMGGGTGTGAAPIIAEIAKEYGILTVGIVTLPFSFEGRKRKQQAENGIRELNQHVDTLLVICNDKLRQLFGNLKLSEAFINADNVLTTAAKGIAEIITETGYINVDFEDVKTVMKSSGAAIMGNAIAEGENRAQKVIEAALASPLLNDNDISGASDILLYISSGREEEILMDEISEITDFIQEAAGQTAEIIWGNGFDESLGKKISVTLIATGFSKKETLDTGVSAHKANTKVVHPLTSNQTNDNQDINITQHEEEGIKRVYSPNDKPSEDYKQEKKPLLNFPGTQEHKSTIYKLYDTNGHDYEENQKPSPAMHPNTQPEASSIYKVSDKTEHQPDSEQEKIMAEKRAERTGKLKSYNNLKISPTSILELENEPAYKRRSVELKEICPSSESHISKYSLFDDKGSGPEIRPNNSFLHDNVD